MADTTAGWVVVYVTVVPAVIMPRSWPFAADPLMTCWSSITAYASARSDRMIRSSEVPD